MHSTGKERDSESGLDYFGARYYGSALGRFTSPDWSANPEPVPYANLSNPQTLILYLYVLNNPLSKPDVDGHVVGVDDLLEGAIVVAAGATFAVSAYLAQPQNQKSLTAAVTTAVSKIGSVFDSMSSIPIRHRLIRTALPVRLIIKRRYRNNWTKRKLPRNLARLSSAIRRFKASIPLGGPTFRLSEQTAR